MTLLNSSLKSYLASTPTSCKASSSSVASKEPELRKWEDGSFFSDSSKFFSAPGSEDIGNVGTPTEITIKLMLSSEMLKVVFSHDITWVWWLQPITIGARTPTNGKIKV